MGPVGAEIIHVRASPPCGDILINRKKKHVFLRAILVGLLGLLMSQEGMTERPTERPTEYYQYRLTVSHAEREKVQEFVEKYSQDWAFCMHQADAEDKSEHFHIVMRDFTTKKVDAFRKAVSKHYERSGNGLHAGKFMNNHVCKSIGYFKHEPDVEIIHSGQDYWVEYIETEPAFKKSEKLSVLKEKQSHPVLTYANVLKQATKYKAEHNMQTNDLSKVVEQMVNEHNWWPSRELLTNGIPAETHQRFSDMGQSKRTKLSFWLPHERSDKKLEWADRVATGFYPTGVSSSGNPGDSRKLVTGRSI